MFLKWRASMLSRIKKRKDYWILEYSQDGILWKRISKIIQLPQLDNTLLKLKTTDMEDISDTYTCYNNELNSMEFIADYNLEEYLDVKAKEKKQLKYRLKMSYNGSEKIVTWAGEHLVYFNIGGEKEKNIIRLCMYPSTKILFDENE